MAAVGWMEVGEAVVSWIGQEETVVECMGHGRALVGWMEMGELLAVRVLLHPTTMTAGVPLVRWQAIGLVRPLVHQRPLDAPVVGVERLRGIE